MKDILRKFGKWIWDKITKNPEEEEEEKEYDEFASRISKRVENLPKHFGTIRAKDPLQLALLIENVRTQKKITEANESLKIATWILAIATSAITIGALYGIDTLNKTAQIVLQVIFGLIIIGLVFWVLKTSGKITKFVFNFIRKK